MAYGELSIWNMERMLFSHISNRSDIFADLKQKECRNFTASGVLQTLVIFMKERRCKADA